MTISATDILFYAGALFILFLTPGPVWVALTARAMSGGFAAAWPLALGVVQWRRLAASCCCPGGVTDRRFADDEDEDGGGW